MTALLRRTRGATALEYALLVALIAVSCVAVLTMTGQKSSATFNNAASAMPGEGHSVTVTTTP